MEKYLLERPMEKANAPNWEPHTRRDQPMTKSCQKRQDCPERGPPRGQVHPPSQGGGKGTSAGGEGEGGGGEGSHASGGGAVAPKEAGAGESGNGRRKSRHKYRTSSPGIDWKSIKVPPRLNHGLLLSASKSCLVD